ncbi:hypothetical protein, partial [Pseudomonas lundensis]|uniref:hypothetical protein n=1 Tax=Pseudomonas lundensis TaxID=86185 RepID=UPI0016B47047
FAACLLALAGVFEIGKAHLAHRRLGSGGQAYFSTFENLFGDSQAFLYDFHYKGGKERMAQALVGSVLMVAAVTNAMKTTNYGSLPAGTGPNYGSYPELKKLSVWDARQFDIANWSLNNSILYDFGNGMLANRNGFAGRKIGDFTYYDNGLREYSMGSTSYFSNGTRSIQVTETITVISNGQTCNNISGIRICR